MHVPRRPLRVEEKIELTRDIEFADAHQRDALAAALNAFAHYQNKFRKIDARKLGVEAKKRALSGEKITQKKKDDVESKPAKKRKTPSEADVGGLRRKIKKLQEEIALRDQRIAELKGRVSETEAKIKAAYDERAKERSTKHSIKTLKKRIHGLESELAEHGKLASAFEKVGLGELAPVGVYPQLYGGLTLVKGRLEREDAEKISKAKYVFTDVESNKTVLSGRKLVVLNPRLLTEINGMYFVAVSELAKPRKERKIDIGELVSDYRSRR